jgi:23S rRNA (adenine2030-N6)-methyltransferase
MNYRHEFHAGNFADVLKHVFLTRVLVYLRRKDKAFRYIDTHAGAGMFDLGGPEAARSGEWRDGIGRLLDAKLDAEAAELFAPYLAALNLAPGAPPLLYPGSPKIAQSLLRPQDRAALSEKLPEAALALRRLVGRDARVKVVEIDGYQGLIAFTPPVERRGVVLIDPPFERRDEFERLFDTLGEALRKWPGGTYMIWYPVKEPDLVEQFCRAVGGLGHPALRLELQVEAPEQGRPLARTGLVIVNPPFVLEAEAQVILPLLAQSLARGPGAQFQLEWLARETAP